MYLYMLKKRAGNSSTTELRYSRQFLKSSGYSENYRIKKKYAEELISSLGLKK